MKVRTLCLGVLSLGDATGYEIKKKLESHFSHFYDASFGSIYPALTRLTADRLVLCTPKPQAGRPGKKVYRITPAGRLAFANELLGEPAPDRVRSEFLVIMTFSELLPPQALDQLFDARLASYRERIAALESSSPDEATEGGAFVRGFGLAIYRAAVQFIENNRHRVVAEQFVAERRAVAGGGANSAEARP